MRLELWVVGMDDDGVIASQPAGHQVADPNFDDIATSQFAVDSEINRARSRTRRSRPSQNRIAQTCCGLSARFAPSLRPAFQARRYAKVGSYAECPISFLLWPSLAIRRNCGAGG